MPPRRNLATGPNVLEIGSLEGNIHPEAVDIPTYKIAPLKGQVMDTIGQLVLALDRDRFARQPVEGTRCSLKDFCSHYLESFDGRGKHIRAENWLNDVEELLAILGCTNEQKVAYIAHKLTGKAKRWWQDKKVVLVADLGSKTTIY
jgi:hypothetical protein